MPLCIEMDAASCAVTLDSVKGEVMLIMPLRPLAEAETFPLASPPVILIVPPSPAISWVTTDPPSDPPEIVMTPCWKAVRVLVTAPPLIVAVLLASASTEPSVPPDMVRALLFCSDTSPGTLPPLRLIELVSKTLRDRSKIT